MLRLQCSTCERLIFLGTSWAPQTATSRCSAAQHLWVKHLFGMTTKTPGGRKSSNTSILRKTDILRLEVHDSDFLFDDLLGVCQRQVKRGTHDHNCFLEKGGTLHYSYTLN
ncbi:hypothetical protein fugu_004418 [Takifugu bimaculatus]|uniref:Uncharacterized protein n=1 Tax=Takifugu bimaculatus TaxID=433685 RepID=A0A4Z2BCN2_9TELE|nr:hypothetical protein fugu_004418 [Takifugu bimaculatus]